MPAPTMLKGFGKSSQTCTVQNIKDKRKLKAAVLTVQKNNAVPN